MAEVRFRTPRAMLTAPDGQIAGWRTIYMDVYYGEYAASFYMAPWHFSYHLSVCDTPLHDHWYPEMVSDG